jgi:membrane-associated phospholipid phosphatase
VKNPTPRHVAVHIALGFIAVTAIAVFGFIAWQVARGSAVAVFDRDFAEWLHERVTPGWSRFFRGITLMGIGWVLGIPEGLVALWLLFRRRFILAVGWIVSQVGALILVRTVKHIVERTRPGLAESEFLATGWSFPSGHATRTFVFCGMTVYLIYRLSGSRTATWIAAVLAAVWSVLMAFSRVYLGAHYPSDVIAAAVVSAGWMAVCISGIEEALRRTDREVPPQPTPAKQ